MPANQRTLMRGAFRRVVGVVTAIEILIGAVSLVTIFTLVFIQALQRYLPVDGFMWTGELARFSLIWLTFSAAGLLVTSRGHIALEIADALPSPTMVRIVQVLALVIVAVTGAGLTVAALDLIQTQGVIKSPVLRLPMSWVYIPVLIGAVSTTVRAGFAAVDVALHGPVLAQHDDDFEETPA